jgi:hypothetical protein
MMMKMRSSEIEDLFFAAVEDEQKLAKHLRAMVGKKVVIKSEVDPGVIGGVISENGAEFPNPGATGVGSKNRLSEPVPQHPEPSPKVIVTQSSAMPVGKPLTSTVNWPL